MFNSLSNFIKESPVFGIMGLGGGITSKLVLGKKMKVEGGIISYWGGKTVHTFLESGLLTVKNAPAAGEPMEVIIVGGGGGAYYGGGGGSSVTVATRRVTSGEFTMVVAGGAAHSTNGSQSRAFNSSPIQTVANGGTRGPTSLYMTYGPGGAAGRGYYGGPTPSTTVAAPGVNYGGYAGGVAYYNQALYYRSMGGAGSAGAARDLSGGHGKQIVNVDGNNYYYGGGGGGGCYVYYGYGGQGGYGGGGGGSAGPGVPSPGPIGAGGIAGRNTGTPGSYNANGGGPAGLNTGGGGGGHFGYGGSGCIVVVYETP